MAVSYKVVSKKPGGMAGERSPKYYPAITNREVIDTRKLAELINKRSTFSTADVIGMIENLIDIVPEILMEGNNVRLDGFGTFSIHVSGEGKDSPDQVTKKAIKKIKMAFLPSKDIKGKLANTEFEKAK